MRPVPESLSKEGVGDPQHNIGGGSGASRVLFELRVMDGEEGPEVSTVLQRSYHTVEGERQCQVLPKEQKDQ